MSKKLTHRWCQIKYARHSYQGLNDWDIQREDIWFAWLVEKRSSFKVEQKTRSFCWKSHIKIRCINCIGHVVCHGWFIQQNFRKNKWKHIFLPISHGFYHNNSWNRLLEKISKVSQNYLDRPCRKLTSFKDGYIGENGSVDKKN